MNRYRDAVALRRGIEDRLAAAAGRDGIDLTRLRHVYLVRDGRDPPIAPPGPPPQWAQEFAAHAEALELSTPDLVAATRMLHDLWRSVCPAPPTIEEKSP